jgi:ferredoxin
MRTGVILLTSPIAGEHISLHEKLRTKGVAMIQCKQSNVEQMPERISDFVAKNGLETAIVASFVQDPPRDTIRDSLEKAKLSRLAVSWLDVVPILATQSSGIGEDSTTMAIMVNVARLQRAYYIDRAIRKLVPSTSRVTRRELFRSIPQMFMVETDIPILVADRCTGRADSCDYCRKVCPTNAISVSGDTVMINEKPCIECGACARDCPIGALECPSISDTQILAMLSELSSRKSGNEGRALLLTCPIGYRKLVEEGQVGKHIGAGIVPVEIPCIAAVGAVHHLWARSLGVDLIPLCPDSSCIRVPAIFPYNNHATAREGTTKTRSVSKSTTYHLLLDKNDSIVDSLHRAVALTSHTDSLTHLSGGSRRDVMLNALEAMPHNYEEIRQFESGVLPIFDLEVDDSTCTFCESCQRHCPDQAIEFVRNGDSTTLMFDPASCTGCMICEKNCPEHAITLSRLSEFTSIFEKRKLERAQDENAKCENCGASLGSKRSLISLRKRLSEHGVTDAALRTLNLCIQCKQTTSITGGFMGGIDVPVRS